MHVRKVTTLLTMSGLLFITSSAMAQRTPRTSDFIKQREFIFEEAPFRTAHASTIVETASGELIVAWFGGTAEGYDDVRIWRSVKSPGQSWSAPEPVTDTPGLAAWNPVLFQDGHATWLFFKVGPSPREWVGGYRTSPDAGRTWSPVEYLPAGLIGPVRAKPARGTS